LGVARDPAEKNRGKPLSALLQILRAAGVTRYETPELTLEIGPPPPGKRPPVAINVSPEALAAEQAEAELDDDEGDPKFLLERLGQKHFPAPKADPRRNTRTQ
jgi:hypothetical protein